MRNSSLTNAQNYSSSYREQAFLFWYSAGKPSMQALADQLDPDEHGRKPHYTSLMDWRNTLEWDLRAQKLDEEVMKQIEAQAVEERVRMLKKHAEAGSKLMEKGLAHLTTVEHFKLDADAIRAVVKGAELERASLGLPTAMLDVANMKDEELSSIITKLLGKVDPDAAQKIIEGEIVEDASNDSEA